MDVPIGAQVYCENQLWGRSTQVILNRLTNQVTHIVVEREGLQSAGRKLPIEWLEASTPSRLVLSCSRAELVHSEYVQGEFTSTGPAKTESGQTGSALAELSVRQGAWVEAWDRYAGLVDEFLMDPNTFDVTHVVLREIHLWGNRRVVVPVSAIWCIEEGKVRLKLDIDNIDGLQSMSTEQPSAQGSTR
jgi:hypothetical protein